MRQLTWVAAIGLAGCGQVPVMSMVELARFDPLSSDLAAVTVAVDVSDGLRVAPEGAVMLLRAAASDGRAVSEEFILDERRAAEGARWLFGVAEEDAARLEDTRQAILALKAEDPDTAGQLSVSAAPCIAGARAEGPQIVDVFIQLAPDRPFVPVAPRLDLIAEGVPVPAC
ncbi:hypothetical protein [Dinoroseobacter sp. S124A]|uniref:hypothetical protein n=1 Tax=Dinoroseobacter sp. S124A TaxID=3415128 RepID=UPI003C7ECEF2